MLSAARIEGFQKGLCNRVANCLVAEHLRVEGVDLGAPPDRQLRETGRNRWIKQCKALHKLSYESSLLSRMQRRCHLPPMMASKHLSDAVRAHAAIRCRIGVGISTQLRHAQFAFRHRQGSGACQRQQEHRMPARRMGMGRRAGRAELR